MYELSDFRKGLNLLLDGEPYSVVDFQRVQFCDHAILNHLAFLRVEFVENSRERKAQPHGDTAAFDHTGAMHRAVDGFLDHHVGLLVRPLLQGEKIISAGRGQQNEQEKPDQRLQNVIL